VNNDDTNRDPFEALRGAVTPPAGAEAKRRATAAAMAAFEEAEKSSRPTQGSSWGQRLMSIVSSLNRKSIMDIRLPIGTAAIALLVLPLGYQLYSTTSMTRPGQDAFTQAPAIEVPPAEVAEAQPAVVPKVEDVAPPPLPAQIDAAGAADQQMDFEIAPANTAEAPAAPEPLHNMAEALGQDTVVGRRAAPMSVIAPSPAVAPNGYVPSGVLSESASFLPAPSATQPSGDEFGSFDEQRLHSVVEEPVSTFSIDVDTASYSYVRRMLEDGFVPEPDAVRIEELINYFPYDYPSAASTEVPFQPTMAIYPTPWNPQTQLLHIGIKGYVPPATEAKPANLVFLIDTSGSMEDADKLPLLKRAFALLVEQLAADDTVSIVVYAGSAGVVLEPTPASEKATILNALNELAAGGSTAGAEGIELAYRLANEARVEGGTNRVVLATDGDFNVGIADPAALIDFIAGKRDSGISLSVLGFGRGNLDDATMQALAQNGNGNASYISSFREAQKVLVEEMGGTLDTIAQDVKIQVEFNPSVVAEYRLIGYETRALNREDFNNDAVDAGDIGAGHSVTAIYEIVPVGSAAQSIDPLRYGAPAQAGTAAGEEIAFLKMRYKLPGQSVSQLIETPVTASLVYGDIGEVSDDLRFAAAVAAFGQKLRGSVYGNAIGWGEIAALAMGARGNDESGYRSEFVSLVKTAALLKPDADR
jgi:Ca-activated chloride channel family protein